MKELPISLLDERLQKQVRLAHEALGKGGVDYAVQVWGELLKHHPGAYEVRALLWKAISSEKGQALGVPWLRNKSCGLQFKLSTRSLLKSDPVGLIRRCDEQLRQKQVFTELFVAVDRAAETLNWLETRVVACRVLTELQPEKTAPHLLLAQILLDVNRPHEAIEHMERVLARDPSNGEAQILLKMPRWPKHCNEAIGRIPTPPFIPRNSTEKLS